MIWGGADDRRWFAAAAFVSAAVLLTLGLGPHRFPEWANARTLVLALLAFGGPIVAAIDPVPFRRRPVSGHLLLAAFAWVLIVSTMGDRPLEQTLVAASLLGTVSLGLTVGRRWPWPTMLLLLSAASVVALALASTAGSWTRFDERWAGFTEEPNHLAAVAAIAVVIGFANLPTQPMGSLAASLGILVLFKSSAVFPTFAAAAGLVALQRHRLPRFWARGASAAVISTVVAIAVIVVAVPAAILPGDGSHLKTLNDRTGIWSFLSERIAERPLLGHGTWSVHDLTSLGTFDERVHWAPTHAHNALVELAVAGGWPAAGLFAAALAAFAIENRASGMPAVTALVVTTGLLSITEPLVREPTFPLLVLAVAFAVPSQGTAPALGPDHPGRLSNRPSTGDKASEGRHHWSSEWRELT